MFGGRPSGPQPLAHRLLNRDPWRYGMAGNQQNLTTDAPGHGETKEVVSPIDLRRGRLHRALFAFTEIVHHDDVGPVAPEQREFLGKVLTSGRHLLRVINDVLDLAKVESGKLEFHPEPVDVPEVVGEGISSLEAAAVSGNIQVRTELDETVRRVLADPARLKPIVYNSLSNALEFTPPGWSVLGRPRPEGPDAFLFEAEDSGVGIKPGDLPRLFVEFPQPDAGSPTNPARAPPRLPPP